MNKQQQIEEIAKIIRVSYSKSPCTTDVAEEIYSAGYRKTFTSNLASDTQKAFKEGYEKAQAEWKEKLENGELVGIEWHNEQVLHAESEIERLETEKEQLNARLVKVLLSIDTVKEMNIMANAETLAKQTVKDFAEELKKKMRAYMIASGASARPWVLSADYVFSEIDCVLKEYEK